jgi:hypothetical protein
LKLKVVDRQIHRDIFPLFLYHREVAGEVIAISKSCPLLADKYSWRVRALGRQPEAFANLSSDE